MNIYMESCTAPAYGAKTHIITVIDGAIPRVGDTIEIIGRPSVQVTQVIWQKCSHENEFTSVAIYVKEENDHEN